jgi:hypothetical protein
VMHPSCRSGLIKRSPSHLLSLLRLHLPSLIKREVWGRGGRGGAGGRLQVGGVVVVVVVVPLIKVY